MKRFLWTTLITTTLFPTVLWAGKIKTYTAALPAQFEKAQFHQAVISNEGTIQLARWLKPLPLKGPLEATRIWDVVEDKAGNLFVATGDEGKLFKIAPDGAVSVAFDSEDTQILCLLAAPDGSIYAGTGPSGLIVRIAPDGNARVLHDSPENYIWALVFDEKTQTVFAATGPHGRIYKINAEGKAELFFQSKQDHILSMVRANDGAIYAGTDKQGLVYKIDLTGKAFVLFQAPQAEIRCLQLFGQALYVGTSSPAGGHAGNSSASTSSNSGNVSAALTKPAFATVRAASDEKTASAAGSANSKEKESEKLTPAAAAPSPSSGENCVYRIGLDGSVRELFREKGLILSMLKHGDRLFAGTGSKGQLFEIHESNKERSEIAKLDHGQIQHLLLRKDGSIVLAASDPGTLYVLQDRFVAKGSVLSEVIDAKLPSRWGSMSWQADVPKGTKLTVAVRGGNVAEPDATWSAWSAEQDDPNHAIAQAPASRFLQYRISMATSEQAVSPALHRLSIYYATINQAPEVTSLDAPNLETQASAKEPKKWKFKWSATDANEDELVYDLYVRKDGWKEWVKIEDGWAKTEYEWDTSTMPSGLYQFKVVASDRPDNREEDALTGARVSLPLAVSHEAPTITLKFIGMEKNRAILEANADSELVRLASAQYAVNSGKWMNLFPVNGLFDARRAKFHFQTESLTPGTYVVVIRVRDAAGNTGSADTVFTVK
ncbi:MAG TPA: hypothetical protein VKS79_25325 [Gemmataceae bacterium]|nr:hypothetical protein [Gemmataceae bacterium]